MSGRIAIALLFLLFSCSIAAQKQDHYLDSVQCYYFQEETDALFIYDDPNGNLIDSLPPLSRFCYYIISIAEVKEDWLRIKNLQVKPCDDHPLIDNQELYKNNWVKIEDLLINSSQFGSKLYREHSYESEVVFESNEFYSVSPVAIDGLWAKVRIEVDGHTTVG